METPGTPTRFGDDGNAEAGPSTPRSYRTPPETPTKSGGTRRRSWFGFGGFGGLSTPSKERLDSPRRSSLDVGLELDDRGQPNGRGQAVRQDGDATEELTIDAQPTSPTARGKRRSKPSADAGGDGEVMALRDMTKRSGSDDHHRQSKDQVRSSVETAGPEVSFECASSYTCI